MKLIIDIDDKIYEFIKNLNYVILARGNGKTISMHIMRAIKQGLPYKERPQGEWVEFESGYRCSNCDDIEVYTPNFCPNCGADMRGSKKETTFDDYLKEQLKDPEFRKEWDKLCDDDMQKGDTE